MKLIEIERTADIETYSWIKLENVESIELKNKRIIFPNLSHNKFYFDNKYMYIKNGSIEPYGICFSSFYVSRGGKNIDAKKAFISNPYYKFRSPKPGDILFFKKDDIKIEYKIIKVIEYSNGYNIELDGYFDPFNVMNSLCGFYDPVKYCETSMHFYNGTLFMNFIEKNIKKNKKIEFSEKIPYWKIRSINTKEG